MPNENFFALLKSRMDLAGAAPCLSVPGGPQVSYADLDTLSAKMAGALVEAGVEPGDRVLAQIGKSPEAVGLYLGTMRAGLVYTPLNTAYTPEEVRYFLEDATPAVFVSAPDGDAPDGYDAALLTLDQVGGGTLMDAAREAKPYHEICECGGDDLASILYTSGTTGRSKGAMLTHANLASNAMALHALWGFQEGDVLAHALPIFHIHGLFVALHTSLLNGSETLFVPSFTSEAMRAALQRATVMMGVPTFYTRLLADEKFTRETCAHMRLFISGSAPLTRETFNAFEERTGFKILERYGMSEAGMIASNPLDGDRVAGTVGFALPDVDMRIVKDAAPAAAGEPGDLQIRGPNVFAGYWNQPEKTKEAFTDDGWFDTGDIGAIDEAGRLSLSGRAKDLIIAGGYNIYPKEIESVLDAVPGVQESAVVGAPHPDMGEGVVAFLVAEKAQLAQETIDAALAVLARFKHPRRFFWIDAVPRNAMGKVQKTILRREAVSAFQKD